MVTIKEHQTAPDLLILSTNDSRLIDQLAGAIPVFVELAAVDKLEIQPYNLDTDYETR